LSAPSRASASNIEKMAKKIKNLQYFLHFSKVLVQIGHIIACSTRLVNAFKQKITGIGFFQKVFTEIWSKISTFDDFFSHKKISPITELSISYLLEWLGG
jgi:hypothetical protein